MLKHLQFLLYEVSVNEVSPKERNKRCINYLFFKVQWNPWLTGDSCSVAVQVLEVLPGQKHLMIPDHGKWVLELKRQGWLLRRSQVKILTILNLGLLAEIPRIPFCVHYILCCSHVTENIAPWTVKQSCVFDRLIFFLFLTSLKDGCWNAVRHWEGRLLAGERRWDERSKEGDLTAKKAPDTHVEAGVDCQAVCKPSTEVGLKGYFPLGKMRPRRRQLTIPHRSS